MSFPIVTLLPPIIQGSRETPLRPRHRRYPGDMVMDIYHSRFALDFPASNATVPYPCPSAAALNLPHLHVSSMASPTRQLSAASTPPALSLSVPIKSSKARKAKYEIHACKACSGTFRHQDDLEVHRRSNPICSAHIHEPQHHDSGTMSAFTLTLPIRVIAS